MLESKNRFRADIQGLRAIAVLSVVVFHIWPHALSGGFVGVDVFFVISGYLITSHLLREVEANGHVDFRAFYLRRARRLLPASIIVIISTLALTPFFVSPTRWTDTSLEAIASLFYIQNWLLVWKSVDYLNAENAPTALQHFWSLSIEEQFYAFWPVLIAAVAMATRKTSRRFASMLLFVIALIVGASLIISVVLSNAGDAQAYFATHARIWELGLGGIVAALGARFPQRFRDGTGLAGFVFIGLSAVFFSKDMAFPGYAALLPTVGAALVIMSEERTKRFGVSSMIGNPVFRWLGDVSYSLYLWHWPLVVLLKPVDADFSLAWGFLALCWSLVLAWITKVLIEDHFRSQRTSNSMVRQLGALGGAMCLPLIFASIILGYVWSENVTGLDRESHPGALALAGQSAPDNVAFFPELSAVTDDRFRVYDNGCHLGFSKSVPNDDCHFGDPNGKAKIFVIGDSHAANWLPALEVLANKHGWSGSSFTKASCPLFPVLLRRIDKPYPECLTWGRAVLQRIASEKPDIVVLGEMSTFAMDASSGDTRHIPDVLVDLWEHVKVSTANLVVMVDTARWPFDPNECIATKGRCEAPLAQLLRSDPQIEAARKSNSVALVDMNEYVCPSGLCSAVIGNILVWRDRHHLTASYSRSLAPFLDDKLQTILEQNGRSAPRPVHRQ